MANECIVGYANQVTLEANGASVSSNAMEPANDASLQANNHLDYPMADFVLGANFGAAVANNVAVYLYRQDLNIDGTNDAQAPTANTYEQVLVGIFPIKGGANTFQYYPCTNVPLAKECQFSVKNGTDQTMSTGWTLKATPKTYKPGT